MVNPPRINLLAVEGVEIRAVCDIVPEKAARAQAAVEKAGQRRPEAYTKGEHDFENLCRRGDLDLVYVATPWSWHVPMAVAAMEGGAHAGVEVPPAVSLEECWTLVDASERTRKHCVILENCCYGWSEMLALNLVRAGMLGVLTHAECAYIHDLRELLYDREHVGLWRRLEHLKRDGNLYPTHGLGPVAQYLGIHRGDRFERLVLHERAVARPAELPRPGARPRRLAPPGVLRLRRHEHEPHPDRARENRDAAARPRLAPALQPHQLGLGHEGNVRRLPRAGLLRRLVMPAWSYARFNVSFKAYDPASTAAVLQSLQEQVDEVIARGGEILFITQRHLISMHILEGVTLVPEYEREDLMEMAMGNNSAYLDRFRVSDMEKQRFDLIVVDPLKFNLMSRSRSFAEENNVWVRRVMRSILCNYREQVTFPADEIALYVPQEGERQCPSLK